MKNVILAFGILAFALNTMGQDLSAKDVPLEVKSRFASMFPDAANPKWESENGRYEAEFTDSGKQKSVVFETNGTYVQTEVEMPVSGLPAAISEYAAKNLGGKKINEASKITSVDGTVFYEAEIGKKDYLFDANGKLLKSETDINEDNN